MPHDDYEWSPREEILRYEEIARLAGIFVSLGVRRIHLTGGEPLLRHDLFRLVEMLALITELEDLSLTTNGTLLSVSRARELKRAGLKRVNVSLDSLRPERFRRMTRWGELGAVLSGIDAAREAGLQPIKLNMVVIRGVNDDEIVDLFEFARREGHQIRFIEYMDVGGAQEWSLERTVTRREILERLAAHVDFDREGRSRRDAPAREYPLADEGGRFGVVSSVSDPFCSGCSRGRLTADGRFVTCLFAHDGHDLRTPMREGRDDADLRQRIASTWSNRDDRYSEERLKAIASGRIGELPGQAKLRMIQLGG